MTTWLVTRHLGAQAWLEQQGVQADHVATHLTNISLQPGDRVFGILPFYLAAEVCRQGGVYYSLDVKIPAHLRGVELTCEMLNALGAKLVEYHIEERKPKA